MPYNVHFPLKIFSKIFPWPTGSWGCHYLGWNIWPIKVLSLTLVAKFLHIWIISSFKDTISGLISPKAWVHHFVVNFLGSRECALFPWFVCTVWTSIWRMSKLILLMDIGCSYWQVDIIYISTLYYDSG